ncbi:MAG TPA: hypothetical protein VKO67_09370, partial [Smithellaceae bacterium]|nr:hypothetical protein [Smithellaceae bacterium]
HVFDLGIKCPNAISGIVQLGDGKLRNLPLMCTSGEEGNCHLNCKSSHFKIVMYQTVDGIGYFLKKD